MANQWAIQLILNNHCLKWLFEVSKKKESFHCGLPFKKSKDKCSHQKSIILTSNFNGVHKKALAIQFFQITEWKMD